jgi:hypothetical protein
MAITIYTETPIFQFSPELLSHIKKTNTKKNISVCSYTVAEIQNRIVTRVWPDVCTDATVQQLQFLCCTFLKDSANAWYLSVQNLFVFPSIWNCEGVKYMKLQFSRRIWGSHSSDYEELVAGRALPDTCFTLFSCLAYSTLKTEATWSYETSVAFQRTS